MKHYNLTNNAENWKYLHQSTEENNWDFMVKTIEHINADETFWDHASKEQVAEISYCCWYAYGDYIGYDDSDVHFYNEAKRALNGAYNCYLKRFKDDNDLRCLMGYMIAVIAYPFEASNDGYLEFEEMGKQMLRDAYKNEPANPLLQYLNSNDDEIRGKLRPLARERMNQMFEPCPGIRDYFNGILGDN